MELQRRNELHIILMRQNQTPNASLQRAEYATNLESFANAIDDFTTRYTKQGIEIMMQVKIFNDHLRKKHGFYFLWKCEKTRFKCFRNKAEQKAFARNLDSLERIDKIIKKEVDSAIEDAENRANKLSQ